MSLRISSRTDVILENLDSDQQPLAERDIADKLSNDLEADDLTPEERKGVFAEWAAFFFRPMDDDASPWNTYYGPTLTMADAQGRPLYSPDVRQIDADMVAHWEIRTAVVKCPVLRARYADLVWDLKSVVLKQRADIEFARTAVDSYIAAAGANLYKYPVRAVQALRRALSLAVTMKDTLRMAACRQAIIVKLDLVNDSREVGNWAQFVDELLHNKKAGLTDDETNRLVARLERLLETCATSGSQFDPFSAEATARVLAAHYERGGQKDQVHRVIRIYGGAFEYLAASGMFT